MKKIVVVFAFVASMVSISFAGGDPKKPNATDTYTKQKAERLAAIEMLDKTLQTAINTPPPNTLTKEQLDEYRKQTQWFIKVRKKYSDYKTALNSIKQGETPEAHMAQMNTQFLALQSTTRDESKKFQKLSHASTTRHEIAMNSVRNMK